MAARKGSTVSTQFEPPKDAEEIELSEFMKFDAIGDTIMGLLGAYAERPDPEHESVMMGSMLVKQPVVLRGGDVTTAEAYRALNLGIGAHLRILNVKELTGEYVIIQYIGDRAPEKKGRNPSKNFKVWRITEQQYAAQCAKLGIETDKIPF